MSHRFQSQSFNWLNRQRLRWNDRLQQGWRSVQVVATWGLQLVLYPLYVAVQSSRLLLHKFLLHNWQRQAPALGVGDSDSSALVVRDKKSDLTPDFVGLFFKALGKQFTFRPRPRTEDSPTSSSSLATTSSTASVTLSSSQNPTLSPQLQGIASLRVGSARYPEGSLVWVDDRNQIWSIPLVHQQALQYQMLTIVANHTPSTVPLKLLPERSQQLPPVRWARRLMNWMQTSPLALATNLFQESQIQPLALPLAPFPNPLPPHFQLRIQEFSVQQSDALLRFLDYHLALLEPQKSIVSTTTQPDTTQPGSPQGKFADFIPSELIPAQGLISQVLPAQGQVSPPEVSAPEVSFSDVSPSEISRSEIPSQSPPATIVGMTLRQHLLGSLDSSRSNSINLNPKPQAYSPPQTIGSTPMVSISPTPEPSSPDISRQALTPQVITAADKSFLDSTLSPLDGSPLDGSPEQPMKVEVKEVKEFKEVEVKSEAIGYEKHPLEHLLHWLDRVVTWIERQLAKLFE